MYINSVYCLPICSMPTNKSNIILQVFFTAFVLATKNMFYTVCIQHLITISIVHRRFWRELYVWKVQCIILYIKSFVKLPFFLVHIMYNIFTIFVWG